MQDHGEPIAEVAVSSGERSFHVRLRVDWNRNGLYTHALSDMSRFVHTAVTDRALQGSAPSELGFVSGSAAAELRVTLAGEDSDGRSLASIFSPYQINSPFWVLEPVGCEVTYEIGIDCGGLFGVLWYPQFVGQIRTLSPNRGLNNVEMTALDRVEVLRRPVIFPPWAVSEQQASQGFLLAQLMESHYIIDHALRQCDCSTSPYRPITPEEVGGNLQYAGTQVFITGNGGKLPVVGWEDNPTRQEYPDQEHGVVMYDAIGETHPLAPFPAVKPKVLAAVGNRPDQSMLIYWMRDQDRMNGIASSACGFTLIQGVGQEPSYWSTMSDTKIAAFRTRDEQEIQIYIDGGDIRTEWDRGGSSPDHVIGPDITLPNDGIVHVHVAWDVFNAAGPIAYIEANAVNSGVVDLGSPISFVTNNDELAGLVEIQRVVAMQDIYFTSSNFGGIGAGLGLKPKAAKYSASVDPGLNRLSDVPIRNKPEAWDVIKSVADAEMGSAFWDEEGRFVFWNFDTIATKRNSIVREITLDDLTSLDITRSLDSVRNVYAMDKSKARNVIAVIYESQDVNEFYVPAGTRKKFRLYLDDVVSAEPRFMDRYKTTGVDPVPTWTGEQFHGYVFQFYLGGAWVEADSAGTNGIEINSYYDEDGYIVVNIWNGFSVPVRCASGSGSSSQPAFRLGGSHIVRYDDKTDVTENSGSVTKYGHKILSLSGDWYQDESDANGLISKFLNHTSAPKPSSDTIMIAGDPRLQLGDTVRLKDKTGFGEYFDVQIYGINRTFSVDSGLTDNLSVQMVPAGGKWDDPVYGIWESTFVWT